MEYLVIWLVLAVGVGVIASNKGRSGVGWFFLAAIISPLIAVIIVAAISEAPLTGDRTYFGVPYDERRSGEVFAMVDGARMSFRDIRAFISAMEERNALATNTAPPKLSDIQGARETYLGTRFKRDSGRGIIAFVDGKQVRFASYDTFIAAVNESRALALKSGGPETSLGSAV